MFLAPVQPV